MEIKDFNPRSREGSDGEKGVIFTARYVFQSTLPRGERRELDASELESMTISIHAPARGATLRSLRLRLQSHFNPRSREGSDVCL